MAKLPKFYYVLLMVVLVAALSGCELRREDGSVGDAAPVSDVPPTLAPLSPEADMLTESTAPEEVVEEAVVAEPISLDEEAPAAAEEEIALNNNTNDTTAAEASAGSEVVSETAQAATASGAEVSIPSAEGAAMAQNSTGATEEIPAEETIVVDASEDSLPMGGPVAANPPTGQTDDGYNAPGYGSATHQVQPGDTLFSIAQRYGTNVDTIIYANGLTSDIIGVGQVLEIPATGTDYGQQPQYEAPAYDQQQPTYQEPAYQEEPAYAQPEYGYEQQPYMPSAGDGYHQVQAGETLFRVALNYGVSVDAVAAANGLMPPYILQIGQPLIIPAADSAYGANPYGQPQQQPYQQQPYAEQPYAEGYAPEQAPEGYYPQQQPGGGYSDTPVNPGNVGTHTVVPGETLFSIAMRYGTSADALAAANGLYNPNEIFVGQVLYLP